MGSQKRGLSLIILLSVMSLSAASQAELIPESLLVTSSGVNASYVCIPNRDTVATGVMWIINGTFLSDLQLSDVLAGMDNSTLIWTLTFRDVPIEYNNTRVQCLAITNNENEMPSNISMLIIPDRGRGIFTTESSTMAPPSNLETHIAIGISVAIFVVSVLTLSVIVMVIVVLVVKCRKKKIYVRVAGTERGQTCGIQIYEGTPPPLSTRRQINTDAVFQDPDNAHIMTGMADTYCQTNDIAQPPKYTPREYEEDIQKALREEEKK